MDSERLQRSKPYPLGDRLTMEERRRFGLEGIGTGAMPTLGLGCHSERNIMAIWDGEPRRPPKKGERYLSGAAIAAYRAPNDLPSAYHIARLVKVEKRTEIVIIEAGEEKP